MASRGCACASAPQPRQRGSALPEGEVLRGAAGPGGGRPEGGDAAAAELVRGGTPFPFVPLPLPHSQPGQSVSFSVAFLSPLPLSPPPGTQRS